MAGLLDIITESPFNYEAARQYTREIQWPAFWISMIYVVVIFSIKAIMTNFKPFELKPALTFWNAWLAVFSIAGSLVTTPALLSAIYSQGLTGSYCHSGAFFEGASGLWSFVFCISKIAELGDTILIVLRKKPLMFLHWYHHVLTLNYGFLSFMENTAFNTWIIWLNFSVHAIMYSYYLTTSFKIRVPAVIARSITFLQILQFVITHLILFHVGYLYLNGTQCDVTGHTYFLCLGMEISYLVLFGNFFYQSYIKNGGKKFKKEQVTKKSD